MPVVWGLIGLWLGVVAGYAVWRCRPYTDRLEDPPLGDAWSGIAMTCLMVVARGLDDRRPQAWWMKRRWPRLPDQSYRRGTMRRGGWVVELFREEIDATSMDILHGDPDGKFEKAAMNIVARLRAEHVGGFAKMPNVYCEAYANCVDHETGVIIRLVRWYDIQENTFHAFLDIAAEVATKEC